MKHWISVFLSFALAGCATLNVKVDRRTGDLQMRKDRELFRRPIAAANSRFGQSPGSLQASSSSLSACSLERRNTLKFCAACATMSEALSSRRQTASASSAQNRHCSARFLSFQCQNPSRITLLSATAARATRLTAPMAWCPTGVPILKAPPRKRSFLQVTAPMKTPKESLRFGAS